LVSHVAWRDAPDCRPLPDRHGVRIGPPSSRRGFALSSNGRGVVLSRPDARANRRTYRASRRTYCCIRAAPVNHMSGSSAPTEFPILSDLQSQPCHRQAPRKRSDGDPRCHRHGPPVDRCIGKCD
jgi:hypothetical protein